VRNFISGGKIMNIHMHKPDWYKLGVRFDHLIHDPRFWVGIALAVLLGLMVLGVIFGTPGGGTTRPHYFPVYPYGPMP
jgi:hypothetical protein